MSLRVAGIVLCGGRSDRMGQSKAWLPCGREFMLQRVVRLVKQAVDPVVVVARPRQVVPALPGDVRIIYDTVENSGPLAGLEAGFNVIEDLCDAAFVTSCDVPLLKPGFITHLIGLLENHPAVIPVHDDRLNPLVAVYRKSVRPMLAKALAASQLKATHFARQCRPRLVHAADFSEADPQLDSLRNVNDVSSYEQFKRLVEEKTQGE